jgi:hypothetical protein
LIRTAGNGLHCITPLLRGHTTTRVNRRIPHILVKVGQDRSLGSCPCQSCWLTLNSTLSLPTIVLAGPYQPGNPLAPELLHHLAPTPRSFQPAVEIAPFSKSDRLSPFTFA